MAGIGFYGGYGPNFGGLDYNFGPAGWNAGQTWPFRRSGRVLAWDMNRQLSQAIAFLSRPPMFQGVQYTAQSVTTSFTAPITLDSEITDSWRMHSVQSDTSQVIVPKGTDGIWLVQGTVPFATSASGHYYSSQIIYTPSGGSAQVISGERVQANATRVEPGCADLIAVSAGDTLQLAGFHTTGSAVNTWVSTPATPAVAYNDFASPLFTTRWVAMASATSAQNGVVNVPVPYQWTSADEALYTRQAVQLALPNPITWSSLEEATAARFNTDIRNSVLFLSNVPVMRVQANGSPGSIASGGAGKITGLQSTIDNWGAWSATTNTWTCPLSGLYLVYGQVGWPAQGAAFSTAAQVNANLSGSSVSYQGANAYSTTPAAIVFKQMRFTAGDTMQLYGYQNSGSSIVPSILTNTRLFTLWMSA
ncbi:hypothetical protein EAS64_33925 [Trebonia kvetii]|uniref:C1q domain-containing protein n=1 Tax=Trebonia kvetii TaxID=2480626 RepID=A0A6P2BQN5_9ACTN|nr:hypothetical protein [Trebonia kvetii]TVZ01280.1 hypothetical protein EAS64_33925 [Trebonia kvetii]